MMIAEIKKQIVEQIERAYRTAVEKELLPAVDLPEINLEVPRDKNHGDLASNIAMISASRFRQAPAKTAAVLLPLLREEIKAGGPVCRVEADERVGFLNFTLSPAILHRALSRILSSPGQWGMSAIGGGEKILLEFVSANPTGPLTVAHGRQAAVGDVLANLLDRAGFSVGREYYLNDRGRQMYILGQSVYLRWEELQGKKSDFPPDYYRGEYIKNLARLLSPEKMPAPGTKLSPGERREVIEYCSDFASGRLLEMIRDELNDFGVKIDNWVSEKEMVESGRVAAVLNTLDKKGETYRDEGALWFCSSQRGDEKDRVLRKSGGDLTYLASDIAYHREKFLRGYQRLIDFWGPDHHGYIARLQGAMAALGFDPEKLEIVIVQLTTLYEGKTQLSMSTRSGEFISLRQVLDQVGKDAARYFFVRRKKESHLDFDLELARKQTPDNPVYYVQYAHARINSIFLKYREKSGRHLPDFSAVKLNKLTEPEELEILNKLLTFPELVVTAALNRQPHLIPAYLEELSALFHSYYNRCRVIGDEWELTAARLALARGVMNIISEGLGILGVSAPLKM